MAASESIQDILGWQTLTGLIQANVSTLPKVLPQKFYTGDKGKVEGNSGRYTQTRSNRTTARLTEYGAPATFVDQIQIAKRDVRLMHTCNAIHFDPLQLQNLRNYTNYDLMQRGKEEVVRQVKEFKTHFENLRNIAALRALAQGHFWWDSNGNLLNTSAGANVTVDFQIPAAQLGVNITTFMGTASGPTGLWNVSTTDIATQLLTIKQYAQFQHGYEPEIVIYGRNIPEYLAQNDSMQPYLARNPSGYRPNWVSDGDIAPDYDLFGLRWYNGMRGFQNSSLDGSTQKIIDDNAIIFLPGPSSTWWETLEGSMLVPTSFQPMTDAVAGLDSMTKVYGQFGYSVVSHNPVGIDMIFGDTFLPVIKVPEVVYSLTAV